MISCNPARYVAELESVLREDCRRRFGAFCPETNAVKRQGFDLDQRDTEVGARRGFDTIKGEPGEIESCLVQQGRSNGPRVRPGCGEIRGFRREVREWPAAPARIASRLPPVRDESAKGQRVKTQIQISTSIVLMSTQAVRQGKLNELNVGYAVQATPWDSG